MKIYVFTAGVKIICVDENPKMFTNILCHKSAQSYNNFQATIHRKIIPE